MQTDKHGMLLIDKPVGMTSRQAIIHVSKSLSLGTVGHTGTLDPYASGLLVVLIGTARKLQNFFTGHDKQYQVVVHLGATSQTDDAEGPIVPREITQIPSLTEVEECLTGFVGAIEQIPPQYSAVRIAGKRAYDLARAGQQVSMPPRQVVIYDLQLVEYQFPQLHLVVTCSAGTYIRSLARDIGENLQVGGYVSQLRRTKIDCLDVAQAIALEEAKIEDILPLERVLGKYAKVDLPIHSWDKVRTGQKLAMSETVKDPAFIWIDKRVVAIAKTYQDGVAVQKLLIPQNYSFARNDSPG